MDSDEFRVMADEAWAELIRAKTVGPSVLRARREVKPIDTFWKSFKIFIIYMYQGYYEFFEQKCFCLYFSS